MNDCLEQIRAIERDVVRPAFAEVCGSSALRSRGLSVTHETGHPERERAREIYGEVWREARHVSRDAASEAPGRWVGSTLVLEELDGLGRSAHPLAGVLLVAVVYDVHDDGVVASTHATHFMMYDRTLHTMERRFTASPGGALTRTELVTHVLDALTFFALHAMSLTDPFEGGAHA